MIRIASLLWVLVLALLAFRGKDNEILIQNIPKGWPEPVYDFSKHPISKEGFELGKKLFHDPGISRDGTISCASCHSQFNAFTHVDHPVSHGIDDRVGKRNSPVLINLAWGKNFHWDGGVLNLQMQPLNPITNRDEMDNTLENVLYYLKQSEEYRAQFKDVYGDSEITSARFLKAIEQYVVSLISANSKYDKYMNGEISFTKQETKGLKLFRKHCSSCHPEPLFTTNGFGNNGIQMDTIDYGKYEVSQVDGDKYQFKIPTLRNIAYSFPYMHNGSMAKLQDVIEHYATLTSKPSSYLSAELKNGIALSEKEKKDLLAFLYTLTDKEFLFNRDFMP